MDLSIQTQVFCVYALELFKIFTFVQTFIYTRFLNGPVSPITHLGLHVAQVAYRSQQLGGVL